MATLFIRRPLLLHSSVGNSEGEREVGAFPDVGASRRGFGGLLAPPPTARVRGGQGRADEDDVQSFKVPPLAGREPPRPQKKSPLYILQTTDDGVLRASGSLLFIVL